MKKSDDEKENESADEVVLGGVEVRVKFVKVGRDQGIMLDLTPPKSPDGAQQGIEDINARLAGLCRATVMTMNDPARNRLLKLVKRDGGNDRMLYRLTVATRTEASGSRETRVIDWIDPAFAKLDAGAAGRAQACRQQIEQVLAGEGQEEQWKSEEMFEILEKGNYPPAIKEQTEEEARRGMLEGEEFMIIEIQVVGFIEQERGGESLTIEYLAAISQKALSSEWMKETIRLLSKVCEDTVTAIDKLTYRRLTASIRKIETRKLCLYRLSVWSLMREDGSQHYRIRDLIDPVFAKDDPTVEKRSVEARRLAGMVMGDVN